MNNSKPALWTRDFILTSIVNFFLILIFYLLMVTIAVYAVNEYGASTSEAGLVTGIFILGALTGRIFIGRSIDKIGRKKTLLIGTTLFTLTTFFYFLNLGLPFLMANRFLHGMTLGMASTAAGTIVAQIIPMTRKGEGIGYFSMSSTLAAAFGPFIGLMLSQYSSYEMIFTVCLALGVISLVISSLVYVPPVEAPPNPNLTKGFKVSEFIEPKAVPIAIICLVISLCYSSVLSFINFYAMEENLVQAASYFFLVYAISILISRPFTGRLMDLKGANFIMYPAFVLFASGLFLLNISNSSTGLLVAGALIGFGFGNMQSTTQAVAIKLTPTHRMGLATSTFFIAMDTGLGFGPYLLGFIIPMIGYNSLYGFLGFVVLATAFLYYVLHGKKERADAVELGYK
ncbi:major facilitator family transporter [Planococcus sp. PAMC 21323]|uniref:MFS transporter n=1 Tax=Planococcus sp. PAMC 21323 TaxID=1526927 RepID=UPI00056DC1F4|nr:MFS transporter [Planococcus sp. PAMC 21323]AIY06903.1 major facilitator family transporter [Planococcus sp. PAMC 21323]